jgi:hypothetical protein
MALMFALVPGIVRNELRDVHRAFEIVHEDIRSSRTNSPGQSSSIHPEYLRSNEGGERRSASRVASADSSNGGDALLSLDRAGEPFSNYQVAEVYWSDRES